MAAVEQQRNPESQHFVANTTKLEWMRAGREATLFGFTNREVMKFYSTETSAQLASQIVSKVSADPHLQKDEQMKNEMVPVLKSLTEAAHKNDVFSLLRAYTAESPFYRQLNERLAREDMIVWTMDIHFGEDCEPSVLLLQTMKWEWHKIFALSVYGDERLRNPLNQWRGIVYRGMRCTPSDIQHYRKGDYIVNMAFLSTSKRKEVTTAFLGSTNNDDGKVPVLCTYILNEKSFAVDIKSNSVFPGEEEVLIMPQNTFKVKNIRQESNTTTIELISIFGLLEGFTSRQKCSLA